MDQRWKHKEHEKTTTDQHTNDPYGFATLDDTAICGRGHGDGKLWEPSREGIQQPERRHRSICATDAATKCA